MAVAKHSTPKSCWVVLYGNVYDVTDFLPQHPGGARIILQLAGKDATDEYDPVHPPGTLEEHLSPSAKLGSVDPSTAPAEEKSPDSDKQRSEGEPAHLDTLLNLDDFEEAATRRISRKAWAYYFSAGDDLISKKLNNTVYQSILLRPRMFVDCTKCDTTTTILGHRLEVPFYASPAAMARLAHPDGERGIAQACASFGALQIISHNASMTPEQIVEGAPEGQIFGWQLYVQQDRSKSEVMLARINKLPAIKFICLTLDAPVPGKREHDERSKTIGAILPVRSKVQSDGDNKTEDSGPIGKSLFFGTAADLTWERTLPWLAKHTSLPIVIKGIQTHEDAFLATRYYPQIQAIILSNHGGRAVDTAPPAIHTLLEIRKYCPEVFRRTEVWIDGGIRRGTDIVKALCLGARVVGLGRAPLWGLGAGGKEGVERTWEIVKDETETCMRLLGASKVSDLGPWHINSRAVEKDIYDGPSNLDRLELASAISESTQKSLRAKL